MGVGASTISDNPADRKAGGKPDRWPIEPTGRAGQMPECRGAGLQSDQKVNKCLGLYPVGNGLSKRKQL